VEEGEGNKGETHGRGKSLKFSLGVDKREKLKHPQRSLGGHAKQRQAKGIAARKRNIKSLKERSKDRVKKKKPRIGMLPENGWKRVGSGCPQCPGKKEEGEDGGK